MLKDSLDESYHVNMLISLLLRFPEIYTITFNVPSSSCCLSYMIKRKLDQKEFLDLQKRIKQNLEAFYFLHDCEDLCNFKTLKNSFPGLTQIQIILGGDSLLGDAISLLTKTVDDFFKTDLIGEIRPEREGCLPAIAAPVEELLSRSPSAAHNRRVSHLFAFRDAGKVYIYDK